MHDGFPYGLRPSCQESSASERRKNLVSLARLGGSIETARETLGKGPESACVERSRDCIRLMVGEPSAAKRRSDVNRSAHVLSFDFARSAYSEQAVGPKHGANSPDGTLCIEVVLPNAPHTPQLSCAPVGASAA